MSEHGHGDPLAATRGVHNVETDTSWDPELYSKRALERQDKELGVKQAAEIRQRTEAARADGEQRSFLSRRAGAINFERDVSKRRYVSAEATGAEKAGYYCEACERNFFDSATYLAHLNSKEHASRIGSSMAVRKSTLSEIKQVIRERIVAKYACFGNSQAADTRSFEERVKDSLKREEEKKSARRERKKLKKAAASEKAIVGSEDAEVMQAMGFCSFGG